MIDYLPNVCKHAMPVCDFCRNEMNEKDRVIALLKAVAEAAADLAGAYGWTDIARWNVMRTALDAARKGGAM